jgi:hypothetical protein
MISQRSWREHKAWGVSPRIDSDHWRESPWNGRQPFQEWPSSCPLSLASRAYSLFRPAYLGLTPQALCWRRLGCWPSQRSAKGTPGAVATGSHPSRDEPGRYRSRFCIALATSSRFTDSCSPDFISLIATSPRARSSSPTISTNGMPRDDAYLTCFPILSASG